MINAAILSLVKKLRSSIRTQRNLHLKPEEIAVLLHDDIFNALSRLEADALREECALAIANDNKLGLITSGSAPKPAPGTSAGSKPELTDALARGARARALSEVKLTSRHGKP
jgi:hypothetical protein